MELTIIGLLIALVLGAIFIFYITHKILQVIFFIFSFLIVITLIIGGFVVADAKTFQDKIQTEDILLVLMNNDTPSALIDFSHNNISVPGNEKAIMESLTKKAYDSLLKKYYKLFFIKVDILNSVNQNKFDIQSFNLTKQQIINALKSDDPFSSLGINKEFIPPELTASKLKAVLFMSALQKQLTENPIFLLKEYKKGNIYVYKETAMFKVIRYIPISLVNKIIEKAEVKLKGEKNV